MNLLEYEAKQILRNCDIPTPEGVVVDETTEFSHPVVLKSQVPTGGRGKLGGIKVVQTEADYIDAVQALKDLSIKGFKPTNILAEELIDIDREYYLSILVNRDTSQIEIVVNKNGGVEVEDNDTDSFVHLPIDTSPDFDSIGQTIADEFELPSQSFALADLSEKLLRCFRENDASLIEINPLVLTKQATLVVADCKMTLDTSASFRHPDWKFETVEQNTNFVTLDEHGVLATIANGAGLAMATVDAVEASGVRAANFLDIGGGANEASVLASFETISRYPSVRGIVINIFAGITRCDEVARAIIAAKKQIAQLPPLYIRLAGTHSEEANALLEAANVHHSESLESCIALAKKELSL